MEVGGLQLAQAGGPGSQVRACSRCCVPAPAPHSLGSIPARCLPATHEGPPQSTPHLASQALALKARRCRLCRISIPKSPCPKALFWQRAFQLDAPTHPIPTTSPRLERPARAAADALAGCSTLQRALAGCAPPPHLRAAEAGVAMRAAKSAAVDSSWVGLVPLLGVGVL